MFAYPDCDIGFIQTCVYESYQFHGVVKPSEILYKTFLLTES